MIFDELLLLLGQERSAVCFREKEEAEALHDHGSNGSRIEDPWPAAVLGDETTCNGPDGWAEEGHQGVESHCSTTLLWEPNISKDTTADTEGCAAAETGEETEGDEFWDACGETAGQVENEVEEIGQLKDDFPAEQFGARTQEQRTNGKCEQEDGHGQCSF